MVIISNSKILSFSVVMAVTFSLICIAYFEYTRYIELPKVQYENGMCKDVVNFKNGDAFVCKDLNVTLRKFRKF